MNEFLEQWWFAPGLIVVGVVLLVLGLTGYEDTGFYRGGVSRGFPTESRVEMACGAGLLAAGLLIRKRSTNPPGWH